MLTAFFFVAKYIFKSAQYFNDTYPNKILLGVMSDTAHNFIVENKNLKNTILY